MVSEMIVSEGMFIDFTIILGLIILSTLILFLIDKLIIRKIYKDTSSLMISILFLIIVLSVFVSLTSYTTTGEFSQDMQNAEIEDFEVYNSISYGEPLYLDEVHLKVEYKNFESVSILDKEEYLIQNKKVNKGQRRIKIDLEREKINFDQNGTAIFHVKILNKDNHIIETQKVKLKTTTKVK